MDGMINPVDPVNLFERIIVGDEDPYYRGRGAAYVFQQKFKHNWVMLDDMNPTEEVMMIAAQPSSQAVRLLTTINRTRMAQIGRLCADF